MQTIYTTGQVNGNASNTLKLNKTGLHGAVSLNTHVKPKETKLLTIIFSWYVLMTIRIPLNIYRIYILLN